MFYVKKTNAAWLQRRLDQLKERIKQLSEAKRENLISELEFIYDGIERRIVRTGFEERPPDHTQHPPRVPKVAGEV